MLRESHFVTLQTLQSTNNAGLSNLPAWKTPMIPLSTPEVHQASEVPWRHFLKAVPWRKATTLWPHQTLLPTAVVAPETRDASWWNPYGSVSFKASLWDFISEEDHTLFIWPWGKQLAQMAGKYGQISTDTQYVFKLSNLYIYIQRLFFGCPPFLGNSVLKPTKRCHW